MEALAKDLYDRALQNRENRTYSATTMDEVHQNLQRSRKRREEIQSTLTLKSLKGGFIMAKGHRSQIKRERNSQKDIRPSAKLSYGQNVSSESMLRAGRNPRKDVATALAIVNTIPDMLLL